MSTSWVPRICHRPYRPIRHSRECGDLVIDVHGGTNVLAGNNLVRADMDAYKYGGSRLCLEHKVENLSYLRYTYLELLIT
jgi:hypothetical protein